MPGMSAIVPVKAFLRAKQRLSSVLSAQERALLSEAMLLDVLEMLVSVPQLESIAVVTADPAAAQIAASFGARHVPDLLESGVNQAVVQGTEAVGYGQRPVAIIAADVPFATSGEIAAALSCLEHNDVVLTRAEADGGTNLLALRRADLIEPCFGEGSFAQHRDQARIRNLNCGVLDAQGLGHDIDRPRDLLPPTGTDGRRVRALLGHLNIIARLTAEQLQSV
jgi:2-phospho-L-lactate guanylyltransferase